MLHVNVTCYGLLFFAQIDTLFLTFFEEFLIQALISQQIVNENVLSAHENLSLAVDKQKQVKF